jgi:hypothetical protein
LTDAAESVGEVADARAGDVEHEAEVQLARLRLTALPHGKCSVKFENDPGRPEIVDHRWMTQVVRICTRFVVDSRVES